MDIEHKLKKYPLFHKFEPDQIISLLGLTKYSIQNFQKNECIAFENDECTRIGLILNGSIEIYKQYETGDKISIGRFGEGAIFGEVIVFSDLKTYPATVTSVTESEIMFFNKEDILKLCSINTSFLEVFMKILSTRIVMLNKRLKTLSHKSIRGKIVEFILDEYNYSKNLQFNIRLSRNEMSDYLGLQRPSLSRELSNMKKEGLLDYYLNSFKIIDLKKLLKSLD